MNTMLLRYSIRNYRSVLDKQELSMIASAYKDNSDGLLQPRSPGNETVLPSALIYGANASGKTNFIKGLHFISQAVRLSQSRGDVTGGVPAVPFLLDLDSKDLTSSFDIDFIVDDVRYHYGFESSHAAFVAEWLYSFPLGKRQLLFERLEGKEIKFGRALKGRNRVIEDLMRPNSLFLSAALQNGHDQIKNICKFFIEMAFDSRISVNAPDIDFRFSKTDIDKRTIGFLTKIGTGVIGFRKKELVANEKTHSMQKALHDVFTKYRPDGAEIKVESPSFAIELAHQGKSSSN